MNFQEAVKLMEQGIECRPSHWEQGLTQTIKEGECPRFTLADIYSEEWQVYNEPKKTLSDKIINEEFKSVEGYSFVGRMLRVGDVKDFIKTIKKRILTIKRPSRLQINNIIDEEAGEQLR